MKTKYFGELSLFVSILIAVFILWDTLVSKWVILIGLALIIIFSIIELSSNRNPSIARKLI